MIKDYIITISIWDYDLPLEELKFTYWYALDEGDLISDLVNMAVNNCYDRLKLLKVKNDIHDSNIVIYPHMITIEEVQQ
jgi:hypothetical protein